jgi:Kef-type K+ transport system membrane component KefB
MAEPAESPGTGGAPPLRHLRAAQMRARAVRGGLVKLALGMVFLVGALAHALSPQRHDQSSLVWITLLSLMSTANVGLGLRSLARARRLRGRPWLAAAAAWGLLAVVLLALLLRR